MITLLIICLIRTLLFKPKKKENRNPEPTPIEKDKAVGNLQALIRCKTVSNANKELEDEKEFQKLKDILRDLFPHVFQSMEFRELGPRELLFHLPGSLKDEKHPAVLMAHFDVVDAVRENWKEDPFAGVIKDGELWGRGTIDTKGTLNGTLSAMEALLSEGFIPEHDIYFAFAGDEEIQGGSAKLAVSYFQDKGIDPFIVLDEGGAVVNGVFPGLSAPAACIGTAEKGALSMEFHLDGEGGHASSPAPHTPVGKLAALAVSIEDHPSRFALTPPVRQMFDALGRQSTFRYRFIFANLWLFAPILAKMTKKTGGTLNALVRTTVALTMMEGSPATNVVPSEAMIGLNARLLPGDDFHKLQEKLESLARKLKINYRLNVDYSWNASRVSTTEGAGYQKLVEAVQDTWGQETIVTPYLMMACSDSRHYGAISDKVYRFSAMHLLPPQLNMIHGDDERLSEDQIKETVDFYYRLESSL